MFALSIASLLRQFLEINCFQRNRRELCYLFCKQYKPRGFVSPRMWRRVKEGVVRDGQDLKCLWAEKKAGSGAAGSLMLTCLFTQK